MKKNIKLRIVQILLIMIIVLESALVFTGSIIEFVVRDVMQLSKYRELYDFVSDYYYIPYILILPTIFAMITLSSISFRISREQYKVESNTNE